jgi:hypothetical protein
MKQFDVITVMGVLAVSIAIIAFAIIVARLFTTISPERACVDNFIHEKYVGEDFTRPTKQKCRNILDD